MFCMVLGENEGKKAEVLVDRTDRVGHCQDEKILVGYMYHCELRELVGTRHARKKSTII